MQTLPSSVRVVGYVRVSTDEQATGGVSLAAQQEKIRGYCGVYDLDLVEVFIDAGASGKCLKRTGLQYALEAIRKGRAEGLVVTKLDRLSRSVADMDILIKRYFGDRARHPVALFSVSDQVDTRTASGRLVLNVLTSVAQWEREIIGERTREALAHKKANGERVGYIPFGWRLSDDKVHLEPQKDEQNVIRLARKLRQTGMSLRQIGAELAGRGIRGRTGRRRWHPQNVKNLLAAKVA